MSIDEIKQPMKAAFIAGAESGAKKALSAVNKAWLSRGCAVGLIMMSVLCLGSMAVRGDGQSGSHWRTPVANDPVSKEALALWRIAMSPVNIVGHSYAQIEHDGALGVALSPILVVGAVPGGVMATCCDVLTGLGEMLTCQQFREVDYPWESFDYAASERWSEIAFKFLDGVGEVADHTQQVATSIDSVKHGGRADQAQTGDASAGGASNDGAGAPATGYGSISGPSTLRPGASATYKLYVGGRLVNADWRQGGTSISVYGSGDHARAMAGTPPMRSGRYRTGIRASYNGKSYSKTIYIQR